MGRPFSIINSKSAVESLPPEREIEEKSSLFFTIPIKGNGLTYAPFRRSQLIAGHVALRVFGAQRQQLVGQALQVQVHPALSRVPLDLPILRAVCAPAAVHSQAGYSGDSHILQQPQLHRPGGRYHFGNALVKVRVQQGGPLIEQFPAR